MDVLKFLFQMGANKNSQDATCGRTMLHYAVEMENVKLVNFLTQEGCDTNAITYSGMLHYVYKLCTFLMFMDMGSLYNIIMLLYLYQLYKEYISYTGRSPQSQ